jgi:hypothetical protein
VKNTLVIQVIIILFLSFSAHSKTKSNLQGGWGADDCGEVLSYFDRDENTQSIIRNYMNGALTGMFWATDTMTYSSQPAMELETINYCRANPLKRFIDAIEHTYLIVSEPIS